MSRNKSDVGLCWGSSNLVFELTSSDTGLIETATAVFAPWRRRSTTSTICRWRIERDSLNTGSTGLSLAHDTWVVRSDNCQNSSVCVSPEQALLKVEYHAVVKCAESREHLGLHAALLSKNGKGVAIVGRSESGKSTLACGLWQQGWSFLCDDYVLIDSEQSSAYPTPRRVSLRPTSRELLGEQLWSRILAAPSCGRTQKGYVFHPSDLDGKPQATTTNLAAVIFLARQEHETACAELRRVDPAYALLSLLPYSNLRLHFDQGEAIRRLQPLANSVPVLDLGRGQLGKMVERIEQLIDR